MASSILLKSLRNRTLLPRNVSYYHTHRYITTKPPPQKTTQQPQPKPSSSSTKNQDEQQQQQPENLKTSWLTRKVEESPIWRSFFFRLTNLVGYGSPKQLAGRRAFVLYEKICAVKPDEDRVFWQDGEYQSDASMSRFVLIYISFFKCVFFLQLSNLGSQSQTFISGC